MDAIFGLANDGAQTIVAVGASGLIFVSPDGGATFEQVPSGTSEDLHAVAYGDIDGSGFWSAVGTNGAALTSVDGYSWTVQAALTSNDLNGVAWAGFFIAVGDNGYMASSSSYGFYWEPKSSGVTSNLLSISVGEGMYVITGEDDLVLTGSLLSVAAESFIQDGLVITDMEAETGSFQETSNENVNALTSYQWEHVDDVTSTHTLGGEVQYATLNEEVVGLSVLPAPGGVYHHIIEEITDSISAFSSVGTFNFGLLESLATSSSAGYSYRMVAVASDSLVASGTISAQLGLLIKEMLVLTTSGAAIGSFQASLTETLSARDRIIFAWFVLLQDEAALSSSATPKFEVAVRAVETLLSTSVASSLHHAISLVAEALVLGEVLAAGKGADISEDLIAGSTLVEMYRGYCTEVVAFALTDAPLANNRLRLLVTDDIALGDTMTGAGIFQQLVSEAISFAIAFGSGDATYTGFVLETTTRSISEYSHFPFNSFAKIGQAYYGANNNGLYRLDADDDDGENIDAVATLGIMDFTGDSKTRILDCFLAYRSTGEMLLTLRGDDNVERWYTIEDTSWVLNDKKVTPARGVSSRFWEFTLKNIDGADFEIKDFDIVPVVLKRRR